MRRTDESERTEEGERGDPARFEEMYAAYGAKLYRFCFHLCGNAADAEDLTQDAFIAAYRGLDRFQGRSSLQTWLYRIALYRLRTVRPANRPEFVSFEEGASGMSRPDPTREGMSRWALEEALARLPDILRETFLLVKVEGLKLREAAELLDIPQGTVKSRLHEATAKLRESLSDHEPDEPAKAKTCIRAEGGRP